MSTLIQSTIFENLIGTVGGALHYEKIYKGYGSAVNLTISNSTFRNLSAWGGGAIFANEIDL
jgi:hypothetical protein